MKLAIGIVADKRRIKAATQLCEGTNADFMSLDGEDGQVGCLANHVLTWGELVDYECHWGVVLEDDAKPVVGFRAELSKMLRCTSAEVVSLYLGRKRPPHWQPSIAQVMEADVSFFTSNTLLSCVGVAVRQELLEDLHTYLSLSYTKQLKSSPKNSLPIDELISKWIQKRELSVAYCKPSLVDHADTDTIIEFHSSQFKEKDMKTRGKGRTAWRVGRPTQWSTRSIQLPDPGTSITTTVNQWPTML